MADLITTPRALASLPSLSPSQVAKLPTFIAAASDMVRNFCNRDFTLQDYDEMYRAPGSDSIILRQWPVVRIQRCATNPNTVLTVKNIDNAGNYRALAEVTPYTDTAPALILRRFAAGVEQAAVTLPLGAYPTLSALAAAVTAAGNGWQGAVPDSRFNAWASLDIRGPYGGFNALNGGTASFAIHVTDVANYRLVNDTGELSFSSSLFADWLWDFAGGVYDLDVSGNTLRVGLDQVRVVYTAGYAAIPDELQEITAELVRYLMERTRLSLFLTERKLGDAMYKIDPKQLTRLMPDSIASELRSTWRDYRASGESW